MPTERFQFTGEGGHQLAASLDLPEAEPVAYALFAHCFTCGKDVLAAKRIAVALAAKGIAVLRFDFTGLGSSEGDFANSTFSSNVADLVRAADHLRQTKKAPAILIGHSLGGAAILAAAGQIPEARAVVTIAAPSDPAHVTGSVQGSHRGHPQAWQGRGLAGRPAVPHHARLPRRHRRARPDGACDQSAQGALDHAFADRRHRRHRQRHAYLRRRQTSQEFCLARGRGSSAERKARRRLCRRRHCRLGRRATSTPLRRRKSPIPAMRRAWSWSAKPATTNSSRPSRSDRTACWPTSRWPPAARIPGRGRMISFWPASAPAPR